MFEWDDPERPRGNVQHIARHGVTPTDAEEALEDPRRRIRQLGYVKGEMRILVAGMTRAGRILVVIYTLRRGRIRVVTAHPADPRFVRWYHRG
ncbi:MAG: BrnT family toxin [Dehalococcoidia bacterium]